MSEQPQHEPTKGAEPASNSFESIGRTESEPRRSAESQSRLDALRLGIHGLNQGIVLLNKRSRVRMHFNRLGLLGIQESPSESCVNLLERDVFLKELQLESPGLFAELEEQGDELPETIILLDELPEKQLRQTPPEHLQWRYWSWTMMGMLRRAWRHSPHSQDVGELLKLVGFAAFEEARTFFVRRRDLFEAEERALMESVDRARAEAHYWQDLSAHWRETAELLVGWWGMLTVFAPEQRNDYFPSIPADNMTRWLEEECGLDLELLKEAARFEGAETCPAHLPVPPESTLPAWTPAVWRSLLPAEALQAAQKEASEQVKAQFERQERDEHPAERPLFLQLLHLVMFAGWRWINVNFLGLLLQVLPFERETWLSKKGAEWALRRHLFSLSYHLSWAAYAHKRDNESEALLQFVEVTLLYRDLLPEEALDSDPALQQLEAYQQKRIRQISRLFCDTHGLKTEASRESMRDLLSRVSLLSLSTRLGKQGSTLIKALQRSYLDRQRDFYRTRLWSWLYLSLKEAMLWALRGGAKPYGGPSLNQKLPHYQLVRSLHYVQVALRSVDRFPCSKSQRTYWRQPVFDVHESLEEQLRSLFGPSLLEAIAESGLVPENHREKIAEGKIKDELLDLVIQRGNFNFSDVRDVISRNDLRLPDITWREMLRGDQLLRLNLALSDRFSEIYRPGEFYLRNLQRLSSLAFGTGIGRWFCRYILIPFGGSAVILGGLGALVAPFYNSPARITLLRGNKRIKITANVVLAKLPREKKKDQKPTDKAAKKTAKKLGRVSTAGVGTKAAKTAAGSSKSYEKTRADKTGKPVKKAKRTKKAKTTDIQHIQDGMKRLGVSVRSTTISLFVGTRTQKRQVLRVTSVVSGSPAERGGLHVGDLLLSMNREPVKTRDELGVKAYAHHFSLMNLPGILFLGFLLFLILHTQQGWSIFRQLLAGIGSSFRFLFSALPRAIFRDPSVRQVLTMPMVLWFYRLFLVPMGLSLLLTGPFALLFEALSLPRMFSWMLFGAFVLVFLLLLNSPAGRNAWDSLVSRLLTFWQQVRDQWLLGVVRWTLDFFHRMMIGLDYLLFRVDDLLRFHRNEKREIVFFKAIVQSIWAGVSYILRVIIYLMVEPQLNPFKHFPVVTVSHKLLIPYSAAVLVMMRDANYSSWLIWLVTAFFQFGLPGIFGFLVWEFKENWREFKANAPTEPQPLRVGAHGETMDGLLRRGFHSGTLPRLYEKMTTSHERRVAFLEKEIANIEHHHEEFHHIEEAVERFVERDLLSGLRLYEPLRDLAPHMETEEVHLYRTHIDLKFALQNQDKSCESRWCLRIELEGSWLLGSVIPLPASEGREALEWNREARELFNQELVSFLQKAGVRIVRSTLEDRLRFYFDKCAIGTPGAVQEERRAEYFVTREKIRVRVETGTGQVEKKYFDLDEDGKMREPSNLIVLRQGTQLLPS